MLLLSFIYLLLICCNRDHYPDSGPYPLTTILLSEGIIDQPGYSVDKEYVYIPPAELLTYCLTAYLALYWSLFFTATGARWATLGC